MKPICVDSSTFENFLEEGAVYVDKTAQLHCIITRKNSRNFFISRPRRFGKSLMISTLDAIFRGKRELFRGLAIDTLSYDWEVYPVLWFDFSNLPTDSADEFNINFANNVSVVLEKAGARYDKMLSPGQNFANAIDFLSEQAKKKVVILIDEYDAPVGHSLNDLEKAEKIRDSLSSFYSTMKTKNAQIRFMLMTGVTKFTQLSVFSSLNHLYDLTLEPEAVDLLGYTKDELELFFGDHMRAHAERMGCSYEVYQEKLKHWSDGYRFSPDSEVHVYNPYTIARTLDKKASTFRPTWTTTGRPSFLAKYFRRESLLNRDFEQIKGVTSTILDSADLRALDPDTVLYQAGYLTIKEVYGDYFTLGIPNQEVRQDMNTFLLEIQASGRRTRDRDSICFSLSQHLFEDLEAHVKAFYAGLPYGSYEAEIRQSEFSYVRIFNALLQGGGFQLRPEDTQTCGRSDLVAIGPQGVYIFEFKVDHSAQEALDQIHVKDYAAPYRDRGLHIFAFGINFDSKTARVNDYLMETLA